MLKIFRKQLMEEWRPRGNNEIITAKINGIDNHCEK